MHCIEHVMLATYYLSLCMCMCMCKQKKSMVPSASLTIRTWREEQAGDREQFRTAQQS